MAQLSPQFIEGAYYAICQKHPTNADVASILAHAKSVKQAVAIIRKLPEASRFFDQFHGLSCNWIDQLLCVGEQPSQFQALLLAQAGINRFVDVTEECQNYFEILPENISYWQATIRNDVVNRPEMIEKAAFLVLEAMSDMQRVYLHCHSGMHRSAIVASVVLAVRNRVAYSEAIKLLKCRRPIAQPTYELFSRQDAASVIEKLAPKPQT